MNKKWFLLIIGIIFTILLSGCKQTMKIADFDGLKDLPKNPSRIVFGTNSMNFDENESIYGEPIEYEVPNEKISQIAEKLFTISYKSLADNVDIDLSPIIRYVIFYNENGDTWKVQLGLKRQNERWYEPVNDKELIDFLYESTVEQFGIFYTLDEAFDNNFLTVEDLKEIASYYNNVDSVTLPQKSEVNEFIVASIKRTYLVILREQVIEANIDGVHITAYYWTYNNSFVVGIQDDWIDHDLKFEAEYFIGGVLFKDYAEITVSVWKKN